MTVNASNGPPRIDATCASVTIFRGDGGSYPIGTGGLYDFGKFVR